MKIDINITDATPEEAAKVFEALTGKTAAPVATVPDHKPFEDYEAAELAKTDPKEETPPQSTETAGASGVSAEHTTPALDVPSGDDFPKPNANGVMVDGLGLPWDDRINSSSKNCVKSKPYNWKVKRNTDPALVETVRRELMQAMSAGATTAVTVGDSSPATTAAPSPAATSAPVETVAAPTPPTPPAEPPVPTPPPAPPQGEAPAMTFPDFLLKVTARADLTPDAIQAALPAGIDSIGLLASRPDLVPQVAKALNL